MNNRVIVIDGTNVQHIAIFNHIAQLKREIANIKTSVSGTVLSDIEAENILNKKMSNREIFVPMPTYTFMNMITGYFNRLNVTFDDLIILAVDFSSWRKAEEKKYKAQRAEFRESFKSKQWWLDQYAYFNSLYEKLNICLPLHVIKIFNCECDDIASVVCRYYNGREIILISTDGDWEQLAYFENVKVFSPKSKKFKDIKNPMKILLSKIEKGDVSDNLTDKVSTEAEWEHRKLLVDLISPLPLHIENAIKEQLDKIAPKNLSLSKIPYNSIRLKFAKIYKIT